MGGLLGQAGGVAHLEPAGSTTQVWGLSILGLRGAIPVTWGQVGRHGQVCREISEPEQLVLGQRFALPAAVCP